MLSKDEILSACSNLNTREVEAFGGTVKVRDLTIKEAAEVSTEQNDLVAMVKSVSYALVEPRMTVKELETISSLHAKDFAAILKVVAS